MELAVRQEPPSNAEEYRAKLMKPVLDFRQLYDVQGQSCRLHNLAALIEHNADLYCPDGARFALSGPDVELQPELAQALDLVFHELALNSKKYGALSLSAGSVTAAWKIRNIPGLGRRLAIIWSEQGGPKVKRPRRLGSGLRLVKAALEERGGARFNFHPAGFACLVTINIGRSQTSESDFAQAA